MGEFSAVIITSFTCTVHVRVQRLIFELWQGYSRMNEIYSFQRIWSQRKKYCKWCNFRKNIISKKHELLKNRKTKISLIATRNKWTKFHGNWQLFFFRCQSVKNPSYETVQNIKNALTLQFIFKWSFLNIYQSAAERESWKLENCWIDKNNVSDSWNVIKTYDF